MPRPRTLQRLRRALVGWAALGPLLLTVLLAYGGSVLWTLRVSFSSSRTLPVDDFVGLAQYERLLGNARWMESLQHLALFGGLFMLACLGLGILLAVAIDQKVRAEDLLRSLFLYPYALSFVATGLVWQWLLQPDGAVAAGVRALGGEGFDWLIDPDRVIYTLVIATTWQAAGLVMAIMLAGLRGVDPQLWQAARVDGIPRWRVLLQIVLPSLGPSLATATVLLFTGVVKLFDAVVAMTQGGPGNASDVPARFIMDHLFGRANIGLASAGAVLMLLSVLVLVAPLLYWRARRQEAA
ncbi:sugar ABC transporter permease [Ideonella sp. 4Y16]|uniref:carbohydrate ABC transporter permease n=1 Tax=Ideonella alba TaxID=2824118 RepID=UPI001B367D58|nr:sugar ABC transporter permease [Ideonella alba]MBQ0943593.1 sugar ABC transporter permease [Ideonella alba]